MAPVLKHVALQRQLYPPVLLDAGATRGSGCRPCMYSASSSSSSSSLTSPAGIFTITLTDGSVGKQKGPEPGR